MFSGRVHDNGGGGIWVGRENSRIHMVQIYGNTGDGIVLGSGSVNTEVINCTIDRNSGDGIDVTSTQTLMSIIGNSITNNGAYGISCSAVASVKDRVQLVEWNLFYENTSGDFQADGGVPSQQHNITGTNPLYTSNTDGSEDYTPQSSSPLLGAGPYGTTIGAGVAAASVGGGFFVSQPARMI